MNNSAKRITVSLAGWQLYLLPGDLRRPVRVEESDNDLHVYAESTQAVSACVHCASPTIVGFGRHERLVRDLPGQGRRVGIYIDGRRYMRESGEELSGLKYAYAAI